ncbi:hypothetical protein SLEP1_g15749 [Rubroshorea leprosula]|uniref:Uncharacterized protein n=1 Tax=Rubroshorea leprosula TaxID=152421 RepID=A0AAV5ING3_9ROSI|nr:hypothetical protein SLEP1_g15749 [Rubroshorea leprosula]
MSIESCSRKAYDHIVSYGLAKGKDYEFEEQRNPCHLVKPGADLRYDVLEGYENLQDDRQGVFQIINEQPVASWIYLSRSFYHFCGDVEHGDNANAVQEYDLDYENFGRIELDGEGSVSGTKASAEMDNDDNDYDSDKSDNACYAQEYTDSENSGESRDDENWQNIQILLSPPPTSEVDTSMIISSANSHSSRISCEAGGWSFGRNRWDHDRVI